MQNEAYKRTTQMQGTGQLTAFSCKPGNSWTVAALQEAIAVRIG